VARVRAAGFPAHADPVIECRGVSAFRGRDVLVNGVDLGFGRHEVTAIVGAPGAGKTVLAEIAQPHGGPRRGDTQRRAGAA
jgi:ABC-type transporter Mla maintaining outer membrane lipid asymmetry ATPase subunit MlaF